MDKLSLNDFFDNLERLEVNYCVLHGWSSLPDHLPSDLDIVVAPEDIGKLEKLLWNYSNGRLAQLLQHETSCFYFVVAVRNQDDVSFLPVDAATDYRRNGHIFFTANTLLNQRRRWKNIWVAAPHVEFKYSVAKKILKGVMPDYQKARFRELLHELGDEAPALTRCLFGQKTGDLFISWLSNENWNAIAVNLPRLKRALLWHASKQDPLNSIRYWISESRRMWRRWCYPTGLLVAMLGPDGAGKSTLIRALGKDLEPAFRRIESFHFRPRLGSRGGEEGPVTDPHGKPPYSQFISILKLLYYILDYNLGYLLKVRLSLTSSSLVFFDRYSDDLLVDPLRYRYGGPLWFARLARYCLPRPDLFLVLDAPEGRLLARKREVSPKELSRQREGYHRLAGELFNAASIDSSLPLEKVSRNAQEVILDYLHSRYRERRHLWFYNNDEETLKWISSVLFFSPGQICFAFMNSLPLDYKTQWRSQQLFEWLAFKDGRGYLIPSSPRQARATALRLYNAQTIKARFLKKLLTAGLRGRPARFFSQKTCLLMHRDMQREEISQVSILAEISRILGNQDLNFAISLGTPGPHRKPVVQVFTPDGRILGYAKIGWDSVTEALVKNEAEVLHKLATASFATFKTPTVLSINRWHDRFLCVQSGPELKTETAPQQFTSHYATAIEELGRINIEWTSLRNSKFWESLKQQIVNVQDSYYRQILESGTSCVLTWLRESSLPFHFRHGDFTPWNTRLLNGHLFLFDWEYSNPASSPGWDLFHFFVYTLWLIKSFSPVRICQTFRDDQTVSAWINRYLENFSIRPAAFRPLFLLYLLDRLAFYASEEPNNFSVLQYFSTMINEWTSEEYQFQCLNA